MKMVERKKGIGPPKTTHTAENIETVDELAQSQESQPHIHRSVRQISAETGIPRSSVSRIIHN